MSSLINAGKHPKIVIIDYYDDLIAQLEVYAEEMLEMIKDDECFNNIGEQQSVEISENYSEKSNGSILIKEFVNSERMRAINEIKRIQKERLEELKLGKTKPTSICEALFGDNQFGFLVNIPQLNVTKQMKFKILVVVIDFYLDKSDIKLIE